MKSKQLTHKQRQGAILLLLLLGPSPISLFLFLVGTNPAGLFFVISSVVVLIIAMLFLYGKQRIVARNQRLPLLPPSEVLALLAMLGLIGLGTFLSPIEDYAGYGLIALLITTVIIYVMAFKIRPSLKNPDERSAVLVLGLMSVLIACSNSCL